MRDLPNDTDQLSFKWNISASIFLSQTSGSPNMTSQFPPPYLTVSVSEIPATAEEAIEKWDNIITAYSCFTFTRYYHYTSEGDYLLSLFEEDFDSFEVAAFETLPITIFLAMRHFLKTRAVYVQHAPEIKMAQDPRIVMTLYRPLPPGPLKPKEQIGFFV